MDELPRVGDVVEREIIGIVQEALTNAVRHARARHITVRASAVRSIGIRLSVADDGRGFARDRNSSGFGMISMQERAERIGASLTIVTAPRARHRNRAGVGTLVVAGPGPCCRLTRRRPSPSTRHGEPRCCSSTITR